MDHKGFINHILFLDIQTVPLVFEYNDLKEREKELFEQKTRHLKTEETVAELYSRAGIWAEFGKIICISTAYLNTCGNQPEMILKSFYGDDERELLNDFKEFLQTFNTKSQLLCAHNGKEFDFPFIARRMVINRVSLPEILNLTGKKPWEVRHLDTMELWKFGAYRHFTSLKLLTRVLGINGPLENICGKNIADLYYNSSNMDRIVEYCENETIAVAQVYFRLSGLEFEVKINQNKLLS